MRGLMASADPPIGDVDLIIAFVRLILASASPRRAELLRAAGFDFDVVAADLDESIRAGESPSAYVRRLAAAKSSAALAALKGCATSADTIVLGADTVVVVDGDILGKPRDNGEAAAMLRRLSGRRHAVLTGISLRQNGHEVGRVETTAVSKLGRSAAEGSV